MSTENETTNDSDGGTQKISLLIASLETVIAKFSDGDVGSNGDEDKTGEETSLLKRFAPPGLEREFQQLYGVVSGGTCTVAAAAAAAIVMGPRGSGKSLLLERCLDAMQQQQQQRKNTAFKMPRKVIIHGILSKGHNVSTVVFEIIRQLSEIAFQEGSVDVENKAVGDDDHDTQQRARKRRRLQQHDRHLLRLRQNSTFTCNLQLLEEVMKIADADGVPILLVLDELDAFLSTESGNEKQSTTRTHHQLLLYLLLDRVATAGSNLILVMMTSSFSCLTLLEKRIRSRAEGTCHVIYTSVGKSYKDLVETILQSKLKDCVVGKEVLARISHFTDTSTVPESERQQAVRITEALERQFRLGMDVRWFSRVLSTALCLYRQQVLMNVGAADDVATAKSKTPQFHSKHLHQALVMMGATAIGSDVLLTTSSSSAATRQPDFCTVDDDNNLTTAVNPRLQAVLDLSTPQLVLLLAAKRILTRQSHARGNGRDGEKESSRKRDSALSLPAPLTIDRMMHEYASFRRKSSSAAAYSKPILKKAALHLLGVGLLVPAEASSSNATSSIATPALYYPKAVAKSYRNMDTATLTTKLPLHIPLEMDREFSKALQGNVLQCPTALKEWGKASN
jgi:Cdc6-like AAA superfamily ATPase